MQVQEQTRLLSHSAVFKGLSAEEIGEIARLFTRRTLAAGEFLCVEGDPADAMLVVGSGEVEVRKRTVQGDEQVLAELSAPTVIGEMSLLDGSPRSATAVARTGVSLYTVDRQDFERLRLGWSTAAYKVIGNLARMLCERLRETNARVEHFFANPQQALATMQERQRVLWKERLQARDQGL